LAARSDNLGCKQADEADVGAHIPKGATALALIALTMCGSYRR
jgi:hypothetical protein